MWAYRYINKETRLQVPTFKTFIKQNHDILKLWCEERRTRAGQERETERRRD